MQAIINPISIFDLSFFNLPHLELATHVIGIGDAFLAHPRYQEVPVGIPHGSEIKEVGTRYHDLTYAVMSGITGKKQERDTCRETAVLTASLALNWAGIRFLREKNYDFITNLGVEQQSKKKSTTRGTHATTLLNAPGKAEVEHGKITGTLRLILGKVPGAAAYIVQACHGDPNDESAWSMEWQFTKIKGGVLLTGLEPGKIYYIRVRCLGHAGLGPWSTYIHIMVI